MKARMILQGKRSAITLCMCLGFATPVAAATQPTATQPPLGVLIVPADEIPQTPANPIARPVPENRPLGILLGPGAPPKPTATAVPDNPFPLRKPRAQPSPPLAPVPQSTSVRPLGLLLDPLPQFERPPLDATLPIAPSRPSVPKTGTSAPPVYAPPAGATTERPLGTLFGITLFPLRHRQLFRIRPHHNLYLPLRAPIRFPLGQLPRLRREARIRANRWYIS